MPPRELCVVPVSPDHDIGSFRCGKPLMDALLMDVVSRGAWATTYVIVPEPSSEKVIAYFTIRPDVLSLVNEEFDDPIDVVTLELLAVDRDYQNLGMGRDILLYIIEQTLQATIRHPQIRALQLEPLDSDVRRWYLERNAIQIREAAWPPSPPGPLSHRWRGGA